jgi:hypothetical protein
MSISPAFGATGVRADTPIVITFSEPMDTASVEVAYQPEQTPPEAIAITWSEDDTVASIDAKLTYPTGDDPASVPSKVHRFAVTPSATDAAGNPLGAAVSHEFDLARHVEQRFINSSPLNLGSARLSGNVGFNGTGGGTWIFAGDLHYGFMTFDITPVVNESEMLAFLGARIDTEVQAIHYDPFADHGDLSWERVEFDDAAGAAAATGSESGVFMAAANAWAVGDPVIVDVSDVFLVQLSRRIQNEDRAQYRLAFDVGTPPNDGENDGVRVNNLDTHANPTELVVEYLLE